MSSLAETTCVIVTRGDVDLQPIFESLIFDNVVVWDNKQTQDLKAFGRYAAAQFIVKTPIVYTQDDDCIVPREAQRALVSVHERGEIVCNMPAEHGLGHPHLKLLGWGSVWDTSLPFHAFKEWVDAGHAHEAALWSESWLIDGCDIVFPVLSEGRRFDLGHEERSFSHDANRTHNQPGYKERKQWYYDTAMEIRSTRPAAE